MSRHRLDAELVRRGLVASRARATEVIAAGRVVVGGAPATSAARRVSTAESISVEGPPPPFVSRGGKKLAHALDAFALDVNGKRCLDAGASTGGFTDCLLQHGATRVYSVDVGRGQLAWSLRQDPRVQVLERTNVRTLEPDQIDGFVPIAVADLSFISLLTVAPALVRCIATDGELVLLLKPQFEAGRSRIGRKGVITDPQVHAEVLLEVTTGLVEQGIVTVDIVESPLLGAEGNREFLLHGRRDGAVVPTDRLLALAGAS
ncbi:MAG: TlyA family RNA methyltransferase [Actinobacteria bacterium]|nr:TlyA family RNA methyltransferase [Actinomycetota bacterium]